MTTRHPRPLKTREAALDIIDAALFCSSTRVGEATPCAAPLAALGEVERAAKLLSDAAIDRCRMMALVLRDPAPADWLPVHATGQALFRTVFGPLDACRTRTCNPVRISL